MAGIIESINLFEESEPQICVWCRHCAAIVAGYTYGYACLKSAESISKRHKGAIQPFPVNTEGHRTRVQCVNADERHDCFEPTKVGDKRMKLLETMGLLGE
jgi:hypothetical protein